MTRMVKGVSEAANWAFHAVDKIVSTFLIFFPVGALTFLAVAGCVKSKAANGLWDNIIHNPLDGNYDLMTDIGAAIGVTLIAISIFVASNILAHARKSPTELDCCIGYFLVVLFCFSVAIHCIIMTDESLVLLTFSLIYSLASAAQVIFSIQQIPSLVNCIFWVCFAVVIASNSGRAAGFFVCLPELAACFALISQNRTYRIYQRIWSRDIYISVESWKITLAFVTGIACLIAYTVFFISWIYSVQILVFGAALIKIASSFPEIKYKYIRPTNWPRTIYGAIGWMITIFLGWLLLAIFAHEIIGEKPIDGGFDFFATYKSKMVPAVCLILPVLSMILIKYLRPKTSTGGKLTFSIIAIIILAISLAYENYALPRLFGPLFVVFLGLGSWGLLLISLGTVVATTRNFRNLALLSLLILLVFRPASPPRIPSKFTVQPATTDLRGTFGAYVRAKLTTLSSGPYFFVVTSGGGIRAALNTAFVLESLDEATCGDFSRRLIAISSVSGGSLGALAYATSPDRNFISKKSEIECKKPPLENLSRNYLSTRFLLKDHITPQLASLLFSKPLSTVFPFLQEQKDSLAEEWTSSWREVAKKDWSEKFYSSELVDPKFPGLFLNATSTITGERLVIGNKIVSTSFPDLAQTFPLATSSSIATVVLDSARFPMISEPRKVYLYGQDKLAAEYEAGRLRTIDSHNVSLPNRAKLGLAIKNMYLTPKLRLADYILDGGYYENYGAETMRNIIDVAQLNGMKKEDVVLLIIHNAPIQIRDLACDKGKKIDSDISIADDSDIKIPDSQYVVTRLTRPLVQHDLLSPPIEAFLNAQDARGRASVRALANSVGCAKVFEAGRLHTTFLKEPALSWDADWDMTSWAREVAYSLVDNMRHFGY